MSDKLKKWLNEENFTRKVILCSDEMDAHPYHGAKLSTRTQNYHDKRQTPLKKARKFYGKTKKITAKHSTEKWGYNVAKVM